MVQKKHGVCRSREVPARQWTAQALGLAGPRSWRAKASWASNSASLMRLSTQKLALVSELAS